MTSELLNDRLSADMLTEDLFVKEPMLDITNTIHRVLFPKHVPRTKVDWHHGCVVGFPGSGKTEQFKFKANYINNLYGQHRVNIVYCDDLLIAIDQMNSKDVQYLIIDDATKNASSTDMMRKDAQLAAGLFQRMRHVYEDKYKRTHGIIIVDFGFQRWSELRPSYRAGNAVIFKTPLYEPKDEDWMIERLGRTWYNRLCDIGLEISLGNDKVKNISVGMVPSLRYRGIGVGWYFSKMVDFPDFPKMLEIDHYNFRDEELEKLANLDKKNYSDNDDPAIVKQKFDLSDFLTLHMMHWDKIETNSDYVRWFQDHYVERESIKSIARREGKEVNTIYKGIKRYKNALIEYENSIRRVC